jgi:hypothetical protein
MNDRVDALLADTAGDELGVLGAEVEDEDGLHSLIRLFAYSLIRWSLIRWSLVAGRGSLVAYSLIRWSLIR